MKIWLPRIAIESGWKYTPVTLVAKVETVYGGRAVTCPMAASAANRATLRAIHFTTRIATSPWKKRRGIQRDPIRSHLPCARMLTVDEFRAMKCGARVPEAHARCFSFRDRPVRQLHIGDALWLSPCSLAVNIQSRFPRGFA